MENCRYLPQSTLPAEQVALEVLERTRVLATSASFEQTTEITALTVWFGGLTIIPQTKRSLV